MAQFKGTIQEFHHFLGPRIKNSVNSFTRKYRNQRNGICEDCGETKELHSAHVHGQERRTLIENILIHYQNSDVVKCDIRKQEEILEAHLPIEKCFKFLCHSCHVAYDSNKNSVPREKSATRNSSSEKHTKITRIKIWANRPYQVNHKIISAYLHLEKNGPVQFNSFKSLCTDKANSKYFVEKFDGNYASMKTDKGNSHGKVFYDQNGLVYIWPIVRGRDKTTL